jgi:rhodanese-related sulfurtransferase
MSEIVDFLVQHWQLSSIFIALLVAYVIFELKQDVGSKAVSIEQAVALYNHEQALLLDVRSEADFAAGHLVGATHLAADQIDQKIKKLNKYMQKPIVVVCATGKISAAAAKRLRAAGFTQAVTLAGGINAWQAAGLPLTTGSSKMEL